MQRHGLVLPVNYSHASMAGLGCQDFSVAFIRKEGLLRGFTTAN